MIHRLFATLTRLHVPPRYKIDVVRQRVPIAGRLLVLWHPLPRVSSSPTFLWVGAIVRGHHREHGIAECALQGAREPWTGVDASYDVHQTQTARDAFTVVVAADYTIHEFRRTLLAAPI